MTKKKNNKRNPASEAASAFGRIGGNALVKKRGKSYMGKLAKKGAEARWKNKPKARKRSPKK